MTPPADVLPDWDTELANALTAAFMFSTPPTDRALAGWGGAGEAIAELTLIGIYDPMGGLVA